MGRFTRLSVALAATATMVTGCFPPDPPLPPASNALTLGDAEQFGTGSITSIAVSIDGNVAAFGSSASDLIADDTNGAIDLFVRDRSAGTTIRVAEGEPGTHGPGVVDVTPNGRFVVFTPTSGVYDFVVYDRAAATTTALPNPSGTRLLRLSDDGARAVFGTPYVPGFSGGSCAVVTVATGASADCDPVGDVDSAAEVSANGRFVIVRSYSPGPGEALVDLQTGTRTPLTGPVGQVMAGARRISSDGAHILLPGGAAGTGPYVYDVATAALDAFPVTGFTGSALANDISADGNLVSLVATGDDLVSGDTNGHTDLFVWNRSTDVVRRVSADVVSPYPPQIERHRAADGGTQLVAGGTRLVDVTIGAIEAADTNTAYDAYLVPTA